MARDHSNSHHERDADRGACQERRVYAEDKGGEDDARHDGERPFEVTD